jgi:hypothetical protein
MVAVPLSGGGERYLSPFLQVAPAHRLQHVIAGADGERHYRERRVLAAARHEARRVHHEKVAHVVHLLKLIQHRRLRIKFQFINGGPKRESLPVLNRLVPEYGVHIALHNHGPGARYETLEDVTSALVAHPNLTRRARRRHRQISVALPDGQT